MNDKVFIIDDDQSLLTVLKGIFEDDGYLVQVFDRGIPAIKEIRKNPPDIIILDLNLPDIDGINLCSIIKTDSISNSIPW